MNKQKHTDAVSTGLFAEVLDHLLLKPFGDLVTTTSIHNLNIFFLAHVSSCKFGTRICLLTITFKALWVCVLCTHYFVSKAIN